MTNRRKSVLRGAVSSAGTGVVLQIASLLVIPLYLDLTSQELYGLWLTLGAILGWIKVGDMGIGLSLTRRAIGALESNNYALLRSYVAASIGITLAFGTVISTFGYYLTDLLVNLLSVDESFQDSFKDSYHILLVVACIRPSCGIFSSIINAKQHIAFLHIKNTIVSLVTIFFTLLLMFFEFGITAFAYALLGEALITLVIDVCYVKYIDKDISILPLKSSRKEIRNLLDIGAPYQALKVAYLVSTSTDNIIIAAVMGAASVTIYVFTGKLAFLVAVFLVSIAPSVLFPGFSQLFELKDKEKLQVLYLKLTDLSVRLGVFSGISFLFINESFIKAWVGPENYGGAPLTICFVVWILFESFIRGITAIIYASGDLKGLTLVVWLEAIINITVTLLLINSLGLLGVVLGTVFSRTISVLYIPLRINNMLNVKHLDFMKRLVSNAATCSIAMLSVGGILTYYVSHDYGPFFQILIFCSAMLIVNMIFHEGIFLYRLKGIKWSKRIIMLKESYLAY